MVTYKIKEKIMYRKLKWESDVHYNFGYVEYLPENFDKNKKYPLVIFLHGAGERGEDLDIASRHGFMKHVRESGKEYPFIFIAPQCPNAKYWGCYTESLIAFLDDMCNTLPVDMDRIYLTGLSMGGTGTFMLAMAAPYKFAAIAPICGSGIVWYSGALENLPVLIYHGDCDKTVSIHDSISMVSRINEYGGNAEIKICYGLGHNAWDVAYEGDELVEWLLSKTKSPKNVDKSAL